MPSDTEPRLGILRLSVLLLVLAVSASTVCGQANKNGQWSTLTTTMPINPIHVGLLHTGKVLVVSGSGYLASNKSFKAGIYDPQAGTITTQTISWDMFCNSMVFLADGRALIVGGNLSYNPFEGLSTVAVFDPSTSTFSNVQSTAHGRWYPTATVLGDGRVMAFSGLDENANTNTTVEIYTPGVGWSTPYQAPWVPPLYPRMHLLPSGNVFYSGSTGTSQIFNPTNQVWTAVANTNYGGTRTYGASVLLPLTPANNYDARVMLMGGADPSTATTEIIDMGATTPTWQYGPSMTQPRIEMNAVILPTGKVLALGGSYNNEDANSASMNADLYDPTTNTFSSAGTAAYARLYHSVALLMPDATVWVAGGNPQQGTYESHMEVYQPAYLFTTDGQGNAIAATRPTISSVPVNISYGGTFAVQTPNAASISSAVLIRPGSPTHAFDQEQRMIQLSFTAGSGVLNVTAPPTGFIAPPGYYMLFLVNSAGVPSVASFVEIGGQPGFFITETPSSQSAPAGSVSTYNVNVTPTGGFTGTVNLSISGLPTGATGSFSPASVSGSGPSTLTVTTSTSTPMGSYPITITGTSGSLTDAASATLVVAAPNFAVAVTPSSQTAIVGSGTSYTVTVTPLGGFTGTVNLGVSGLPTGATSSFSPASITNSGSSTLTVNTVSTTPVGNYPLTITGTSGSLVNPANVTLVVSVASGGGPATLVQSVASVLADGNSYTSAPMTFTQSTTAGNAIILEVFYALGSPTVTITDSQGNTYQPATPEIADPSSTMKGRLWYANSIVGGADTVTVHFTTGVSYIRVGAGEFTGVTGLDAGATASGNSSSPAASVTTAGANELVVDLIVSFNGESAGNSSWKFINTIAALGGPVFQYNATTAAGTYTGTATNGSGTDQWLAAIAAFKTVIPANFTVSPSPSSQTISEEGATSELLQTSYTINVQPTGGFNGTVNLSVSGLPTGATGTFSPSSLTTTPASSTLTVSVSGTPPGGSYPLTITATSGTLTNTATATLVISAPNFAITSTPISQTAVIGSGASYTISVTPAGGFTGTVNLSLSGLPTGATSNFSNGSITTSGSSTLAVNTSSSTPVGSYPLTITGTSGSLTSTATATLTVTTALVSIAVTPTSSSITKGSTLQYAATGTYSDSSTQNLSSLVTWSSTNGSVGTISATGLATGVSVGSAAIQATSGSISSNSASLTVTAPVLISISVTPANGSMAQGTTQQFTATGTYSDATTQNLTSAVTWSSTNTSTATINTAGLATGVAAGNTTIQASAGSISGSTTLAVTSFLPGLVAYWKFDEGSGATAGDFSGNGHTASLFNGVTWTTGKAGGAISANGTNQYGSAPTIDLSGTKAITIAFWVNRTYSTASGHTLFEDSANYNSSTTGFALFPDESECGGIEAGLHGDVGYSVNCYAQPTSGVWHHFVLIYDKSQAAAGEVALYIDGILKTPSKNLVSANNTNNFGNNTIYLFSRAGTQSFAAGQLDGLQIYNRALSASEIQQVYTSTSGAALVSIAVTPANPSIVKGTTQQFTATGTYSDSSTQNLTSSVTWSSTSTGVATISSAGLATGVASGSSTIGAASGSVSGSTGLTVTPPTLVSISVTPTNPFVTIGNSQQFAATGTYSDNSTQNLTSSVTWTSTNTTAVTITNGGLASGLATGSTTIRATSGSIIGSTGLTVTAALVSIAVTPANPSIVKGAGQQFTATGTYSDNSTQNLTNSVTWASSNTVAATITGSGLASGLAVGNTTIQATFSSISGSTGLTVTAPVLVSLTVTPANSSIGKGSTQQFTATGTFSDATTQNLTSTVTWASTNAAIATITSTGLATGVAGGSDSIQATLGSISGSTGLTVVTGSFPWITYDSWLDFEHCTSGAAPTASCLASSTHGTAGTWDISKMANLVSISTSGQAPAGATGDTGTLGMTYNLANGAEGYITWNLPAAKSSLSIGLWYKTGSVGSYVEGPHFITLNNFGFGNMIRLSDERSSYNNARQIRVSPLDAAVTGIADNTWYWCTMKWVQGGAGSFSVYDASLNLVGTVAFTDSTNVAAQAILLGNTSGLVGVPGQTTYFDDFLIDSTSAKFPLLPKQP